MSSRSTTRASSPNATAPFEPHACLAIRCPQHLFLAWCSAPVTSRLVTFSARSGLLAQRSWLYPGFDFCFPRVRTALYFGLARPYVRTAGALREPLGLWCWLRERGVLRHCERLRPSGGLLRERVAAAAHAYLQQQAAACTATPGCLPSKGKRVRTGGSLHPGLTGERLLNTAQTSSSDCWITSARMPRACEHRWPRERMTYGTAIGFAPVVPYYECIEQQPRLTTSCSTRQLAWMPGCMLRLSIGVRTGGRLHPG